VQVDLRGHAHDADAVVEGGDVAAAVRAVAVVVVEVVGLRDRVPAALDVAGEVRVRHVEAGVDDHDLDPGAARLGPGGGRVHALDAPLDRLAGVRAGGVDGQSPRLLERLQRRHDRVQVRRAEVDARGVDGLEPVDLRILVDARHLGQRGQLRVGGADAVGGRLDDHRV